MKKLVYVFMVFLLISCSSKIKPISNGIFHGESRAQYTSEPFWGNAFIEIQNQKVKEVKFYIIDKDTDEIFDQNYENHYKGNDTYIQQCRKDWSGLNNYIKVFNETKDLNKIDSISGATWSFNIFKSTMVIALEKIKGK
jgi:major membrane immunogen (membrane-anchored lipoprotein)